MRLTDSDLKFVVMTVATKRHDYDHIVGLLRGKDDLVEPMLDDPRLVERLVNEPEVFARVSPYLLFAVLLRCVRRDLEGRSFVLERDARGKRIPVFEAAQAAELLGEPVLREYLAEMLCSFVRTNTVHVWRQAGDTGHPPTRHKFCDVDMDDLIALCQLVESRLKPRIYKRIADLALFLTGIYPDHATVTLRRPRSRAELRRSVPDYEREGRRFYTLAAREAEPPGPAPVFERLAEKFTLARGALNTLSDRYLKPLREQCFVQPAR